MTNDITYQNETTTGESERSEGGSEGNPYKVYRVTFPYTVKFSLDDDDHNTEVTISTKSVEYYFGKDEEDVLLQKELSDRISNDGLKKHITRWVEEQMWSVEPDDCELSFLGNPQLHEMTEEEIDETEREVVSMD